MNLGNRLSQIASKIPIGTKVADIGTDHAYLPIYLVKEKICPKVIATEAKPGPYLRAKANLIRSTGHEGVDLRLGDGFSPLAPKEVDLAVVAGMGGEVIAGIIEQGGVAAEQLDMMILQPMTRVQHLRSELFRLRYEIVDEDISREGDRFYEILLVRFGDPKPPDSTDIIIGPVLRHRRERRVWEYLNHRCERLAIMVNHMKKKSRSLETKVLKEREKELDIIRGILKCFHVNK